MRLMLLELENYRRHRNTRLEVPDGVTAVVGRNGAGKSTLLEALGFALFGTGAVRTPKDLLPFDGAVPGERVRVALEFELSGQAVRVERELRGKALVPQASLEVDGALLVAAGAGSSEAVTREVERLLGMDRDAFHTTVLARQKELGRLMDSSPAERKRMILSMLGVDRVERAIAATRRARAQAEARVAALEQALGDAPARAGAVEAAGQRLAKSRQDAQDAERRLTAVETQRKAAEQRRDALAEEAHRRVQAEEAVKAAQEQQRARTEVVEQARVRLAEAQQAAAKALALQAQAEPLARLEASLREAEGHAQRLRERALALRACNDWRTQIARSEAVLAGLRDAVKEPAKPQLDLAALAARRDEAVRAAAGFQARLREEEARVRRLQSLGEDAPCPTCERPLSGHVPRVLGAAQEACQGLAANGERAAEAAAQATRAESEARAAMEGATRAIERAREAQERARQEQARLEEARARLAEAEAAVPADPGPAPDVQAARHAADAARRTREAWLAAKALSEQAPAREHELALATEAARKATQAVEAACRALATVPDAARDLAAAKAALDTAVQAEAAARAASTASHAAVAAAQEALVHAQQRHADDERRRALLLGAQEEARVLGLVAGVRGGGLLDRFRDHLVQRAGPAIGQEAGRLLARLTGGRYTEVLLDDQYRVFVADQGVAYALERFSGGEADLVHLALRLAVSRLLAERSGSEVRFLALDEVLGSLDAERRDLVVASIRGLEGLYSQILLVTHLEGLRDQLDATWLVDEQDGQSIVRIGGTGDAAMDPEGRSGGVPASGAPRAAAR